MIAALLLIASATVCPSATTVHAARKPVVHKPVVHPRRQAAAAQPVVAAPLREQTTTAVSADDSSSRSVREAAPQSLPENAAPKKPHFGRAEAAPATTGNPQRLGTGLILLALMGVGATAALRWKKRKDAATDADASIQVLASHAFSPKQHMQVVKIGEERMLVAVSDKGIQLLCVLKAQESFGDALAMHTASPPVPLQAPASEDAPIELGAEPSPEVAGILRMKRARRAARGLS